MYNFLLLLSLRAHKPHSKVIIAYIYLHDEALYNFFSQIHDNSSHRLNYFVNQSTIVQHNTHPFFSCRFPSARSISTSISLKTSETDYEYERSITLYNAVFVQKADLIIITSFCFALVSTNDAFHFSASLLPSSVLILRSVCKSVLFPTRTIGTLNDTINIRYFDIISLWYSLNFADDVQEFVVDDLHDLEAFTRRDRIHEDVSVKVHAVLSGEDAEFVLTGCVDQFHFVVGGIESNGLREG